MVFKDLNFRNFLEDMDPSMDKKVKSSQSEEDKPIDYFDALEDEEGIEWSDLVKIMQNEPWVGAHFSLGELTYKTSPWEIVKGTLTPQGAYIRLRQVPDTKSYLKGRVANKSDYTDHKKYYLNRKDLLDFFNNGWGTNQGAAGAPPSLF